MTSSQLLPVSSKCLQTTCCTILPRININFIGYYFQECIFPTFENICLLLSVTLNQNWPSVGEKNQVGTVYPEHFLPLFCGFPWPSQTNQNQFFIHLCSYSTTSKPLWHYLSHWKRVEWNGMEDPYKKWTMFVTLIYLALSRHLINVHLNLNICLFNLPHHSKHSQNISFFSVKC